MAPAKPTKNDYAAMTDRQRRVYDFIRDAYHLRGYPPSIREICDATGLSSTSSVSHQLNNLEELGFIRRFPNQPRAMQVIDVFSAEDNTDLSTEQYPEVENAAFVPLVGRIAAGTPLLAEQNIDQVMPLPRDVVGHGDLFMLQVVGESMIDASICDGDWVIVRVQNVAENGDIVAARIDDEATVKTFRKDSTGVWLLPQNPVFDPIPAEHALIMGKVVAVLRKV
ncbi:MAG: transcriptional repressor LexA [Lawsonella sp.]